MSVLSAESRQRHVCLDQQHQWRRRLPSLQRRLYRPSLRPVSNAAILACTAVKKQPKTLQNPSCFKDILTNSRNNMCARPPQYAPARCKGSAQRQPYARPTEPGPISQYAPFQPAGRCTRQTSSDRQTDVRRQKDVRRATSLNAPGPTGGGIIRTYLMHGAYYQ